MRKKLIFIMIAAVVIGVVVFSYRDSFMPKDQTEKMTEATRAAPQVPVAEVIVREIAPWAELTGFLAAHKQVDLRSRVDGVIETVTVPEGGIVEKGQTLFQIDPRPFQVAVDTAKAKLQQAEVLAAQAKKDFERIDKLGTSGAVSRKSFDDAQSRIHESQAQVLIEKAALEGAKLDLSYTQVTAPITGRVDRILVTEGNLISGGGSATLLTTIVSIDPLYAYFDIDEATYLNFFVKSRSNEDPLSVQANLVTQEGFPLKGELDFLGNRIDRGTGTVRARAVLNNEGGELIPGLFIRAKIASGEAQQTILIDDIAVSTDQGRNYVLVLDQANKAEYRTVTLGPVVEGLRIVSSGLQAGDKIILKGLVRPDMQVQPNLVPMQEANDEETGQ